MACSKQFAIVGVLAICILFLLAIVFMAEDVNLTNISNLSNWKKRNLKSDLAVDPLAPRIINIWNRFDHDISVYFEDGESGAFLSNVGPNEDLQLSASSGQTIYATHTDSWDRISAISVQSLLKDYEFLPPKSLIRPIVVLREKHFADDVQVRIPHFNVTFRDREFPAARRLARNEQALHAVGAIIRLV